ncbi:MAG TPA: zf-HC2 domain-containing protein [Myxococcota bacterium]|nr:zf-HC2 domain-containing protein [Myxococcota bacterium]
MTGPLADACARYAEDWSALLDGELEPSREAQMRAHAETCATCAARLASLARVDVLLAGLPVPETRAALLGGLRARIEEEPARTAAPTARSTPPPARRRRALGWWAAAASAAAALAVYLALPRPAPVPPPAEVAEEPVRDPEFDALPAEEIAVGLELDTAEDLDVIANLELLEAYVALEEGRG